MREEELGNKEGGYLVIEDEILCLVGIATNIESCLVSNYAERSRCGCRGRLRGGSRGGSRRGWRGGLRCRSRGGSRCGWRGRLRGGSRSGA